MVRETFKIGCEKTEAENKKESSHGIALGSTTAIAKQLPSKLHFLL